MRQKEHKRLEQTVEQGTKRIAEIDRLIERMEIHNNDKSSGHCCVKVDISFTVMGMIAIATEQEIRKKQFKNVKTARLLCGFVL
ncbi:MAG TPA: hypothetical protein IAD46_05475 [Candidatus Pelethenecus faecipullorum]|uniref:Uncharacterized protein n=1 Tax=Candidatus Pelethenecus faecipullorum TaxID=2840900 RepID=A0A9D1GRX8_9MOLU|nr:hypothetical protein [Candidatus Pelethenecus faecipullorum]